MTPDRKMAKARTELLMDQPFFGALALRMELKPADTETMTVDAKTLYYNPDWVAKQTKQELTGAVAHNVMHVVFQHMLRRHNRDQDTWDNACDVVVNDVLRESGFVIPEGTMDHPIPHLKGKSAEEVYQWLKEQEGDEGKGDGDGDGQGQGQGQGQGGQGDGSGDQDDNQDGDGDGDGDGNGNGGGSGPDWGNAKDGGGNGQTNKELEQEIKMDVAAAAQAAKKAGKLPGSLQELVKDLLEPQVDWRTILWPFMTDLNEAEYSWHRPNRAYISEDEYFPSMHSEGMGVVIVAVDTSGSMSDLELRHAWSEIVDVCESVNPRQLILIQADSRVRSVEEIEVDNARNTEFVARGRGGTSVKPTFDYINENFHEVDAMIYISDMEIYDGFPDPAPDYPTLWVSTRKEFTEPPFGITTWMDINLYGRR